VKAGPSAVDALPGNSMIAYNGDPTANGFGLFLHGDSYVAHIGPNAERILGPADAGAWHHLAYVYSLGTSTYYYDGKLVSTSTQDAAPLPTTDGFWLAGRPPPGNAGGATLYAFNGWVDEVRYQSFNHIAAGAFEPTAFLIVPEPTGLLTIAVAAMGLILRRPRRAAN
jgi:hypothetical protein